MRACLFHQGQDRSINRFSSQPATPESQLCSPPRISESFYRPADTLPRRDASATDDDTPRNYTNVLSNDVTIERFGLPWPKMPFSTRTTVLRMSGGLFIHSPTPLTAPLKNQIDELGLVRWIIGPNRLHYTSPPID